MPSTPEQDDFVALYGPAAEYSDYQLGKTVEYIDQSEPSGRGRGVVLYIAAATASEPQRLIVSPDTALFPVEIHINEVIQP
jgi:hypothetical protein